MTPSRRQSTPITACQPESPRPYTGVLCRALASNGAHLRPVARLPLPITADRCRPLPSTTVHRRPLPPTAVHRHPLLYSAAHCRPLPSTAVHCCPLPSTAVHLAFSAARFMSACAPSLNLPLLDDARLRLSALPSAVHEHTDQRAPHARRCACRLCEASQHILGTSHEVCVSESRRRCNRAN